MSTGAESSPGPSSNGPAWPPASVEDVPDALEALGAPTGAKQLAQRAVLDLVAAQAEQPAGREVGLLDATVVIDDEERHRGSGDSLAAGVEFGDRGEVSHGRPLPR